MTEVSNKERTSATTRRPARAQHGCGMRRAAAVSTTLFLLGTMSGCVTNEPMEYPTVIGGTEDVGDAYTGVVEIIGRCSGTLVSTGRVLTAAHCFCSPHAADDPRLGGIIDSSNCERRASVHFVRYREGEHFYVDGDVTVHPDFHVDLTGNGAWVYSFADFAIIDLDAPPPPNVFRPIQMADNIPASDAPVVLVGFGNDTCAGGFGQRRFGTNTLDRADSEFLFLTNSDETSGAITWRGDSGGAALAVLGGELRLAGVTSKGTCIPTSMTAYYSTTATVRNWVTNTCNSCLIEFSNPREGDIFVSGETVPVAWSATGFSTRLRMVARRNGVELSPPISTTLDAFSPEVDVVLLPSWGVGSGFEICAASEVPSISGCSGQFSIDASDTCLSPYSSCGARCVDLSSDPENCGSCGRTCGSSICIAAECGDSPTGTNLLSNPSFESLDVLDPPDASWRDGGWSIYVASPTGGYGSCGAIQSGTAPHGTSIARCVTRRGTAQDMAWHFLLLQEGLEIRNGVEYTLTFSARAAAARTLEISVQRLTGEGYVPGGNLVTTIGTQWLEYHLSFRASVSEEVDVNAKIAYWLIPDSDSAWIDIDNVSLVAID